MSVSGSQGNYFSKSESTDLSAPSEGSNNHLSAHSTSSVSKSSLDSMISSYFCNSCRNLLGIEGCFIKVFKKVL